MNRYPDRRIPFSIGTILFLIIIGLPNISRAEKVIFNEDTRSLASDGLAFAKAVRYPPELIAAMRSVARLSADVYDFHTQQWVPQHFGSGVLIERNAKEAIILSAKHIPESPDGFIPQTRHTYVCEQIMVYVQFGSLARMPAHIVSYNPDGDQMRIRFNPLLLPASIKPVPLSRRDPKPGDTLVMYGFHFGSPDDLVEEDIAAPIPVGFLGKGTKWQHERYVFTPGPGQGYSGGALLTMDGHLAGILVGTTPNVDFGSATSRSEMIKEISETQKSYCPEK